MNDESGPKAAFETQTYESAFRVADDLQAGHELNVAWLRVHADLLSAVDPSGQLSAYLRDHAHCYEAMADQ